jgi:sugar lactone lactonase YvrE
MNRRVFQVAALLFTLLGAACSAKDGSAGSHGATGATGEAGPGGPAGSAGATGAAGPAGASGTADVAELDLPGATFYPESLTAAKDGSLFVSSLGGGGIVKFAPGSDAATSFVAPSAVKSVAGLLADAAAGLLYACDNDLGATPQKATLRTFDLATGAPKSSYPFAASGFCNDFAFDASGNLFVTDSFGKILKLAKGASSLAVWNTDARLAPSIANGFGADGIAFDGANNFYVNTFTDSRLLRIPVLADGTSGAVSVVTVTPALSSPDGMRIVDANTLVVVEGGAGRLTEIAITGSNATATTLVSRLDSPTSLVRVGAHYWATEGQLAHFGGQVPGPPQLPFLLRRFAAQ